MKNNLSFKGWYPVGICYDPEEGIFTTTGLWDGDRWVDIGIGRTDLICSYYPRCFGRQVDASSFINYYNLDAESDPKFIDLWDWGTE